MYILKSANEEDKQTNILVKRGQLMTSLNMLADSTKLSKKTVRTCLSKLENWELINISTCNRYSVVSVCDYEKYFESPAGGVDVTKGKQEKMQELKDEKPKKTKEELLADTEKRKKKFYDELVPYVETYGKTMIRRFFDYWSETNKSGSRMRFEQERTWVLNLRLQRWGRNQNDYKTKPVSTALHDSENKNYNEGGW